VVARPELAFPPLELANRVGSLARSENPLDYYDELGRETREGILARLPADWTFAGKRVLDFGCGAGRTLRHFIDEAGEAEFWGCDIDAASIGWMEERLCPPFHVFVNGEQPPLDQPDESFDLIWAISVFTHIASGWSDWLRELARVLKPDGLLLVTFMGAGMSEEMTGEAWEESRIGMNVIRHGQSWELGGPMVLHSPWWIEEHWGRAFEILSLTPDGFAGKPWLDHGCVLMRKRTEAPSAGELERMDPLEVRELYAQAHNVEQLRAESEELRRGLTYTESKRRESEERAAWIESQLDGTRAHLEQEAATAQQRAAVEREQRLVSARRVLEVEEQLAQARARVFALEVALEEAQEARQSSERVLAATRASVSWRITAPLRALKRLAR
jgi:SAM-dependent methyltransferase